MATEDHKLVRSYISNLEVGCSIHFSFSGLSSEYEREFRNFWVRLIAIWKMVEKIIDLCDKLKNKLRCLVRFFSSHFHLFPYMFSQHYNVACLWSDCRGINWGVRKLIWTLAIRKKPLQQNSILWITFKSKRNKARKMIYELD